MSHYLYIYFKKMKRNYEDSCKFIIQCLDFFETMDRKYNGFLDVTETIKCLRLIEISNRFIKHNYNIYKYRFHNESKNKMIQAKYEIETFKHKTNKKDTDYINTGQLWDNYDYHVESWKKERCKFHFKDILNIIKSNPTIDIFYLNIINNFITNRSTICSCGNMIKLHQKNECYNSQNAICDFTGETILNNEILHCSEESEYHPYGFDIDISNNDKYIEDKIKRDTISKIYLKLRKINGNNIDIIENEDINIYYQNNLEYKELKTKYHKICKDIMKNTERFYIESKNDLYSIMQSVRNGGNLPNRYISSIIKIKCKMYNFKRILRTKKNWYIEAQNTFNEIKIIVMEYEKFIKKLEPYPFMFDNKEIKEKFITNSRNLSDDYINKLKNKLIKLEKQNDISYEILRQDLFKESIEILEVINNLMYKSYESIEILEKSTVNDEMLEYNIIENNQVNNEDRICTICQEDLKNEIFAVNIEKCGHFFHKNCIDNWLIRSNTCPLCR